MLNRPSRDNDGVELPPAYREIPLLNYDVKSVIAMYMYIHAGLNTRRMKSKRCSSEQIKCITEITDQCDAARCKGQENVHV